MKRQSGSFSAVCHMYPAHLIASSLQIAFPAFRKRRDLHIRVQRASGCVRQGQSNIQSLSRCDRHPGIFRGQLQASRRMYGPCASQKQSESHKSRRECRDQNVHFPGRRLPSDFHCFFHRFSISSFCLPGFFQKASLRSQPPFFSYSILAEKALMNL